MSLAAFIEDLGFNSYEKDAMIYLASAESATAREVYKNTKIPLGRIYSVLQALQDKQILEVLPTKPKRYVIADMRKSLKRFLEAKQAFFDEKQSEIGNITLIEKRTSDKKDSSVRVLVGREEHLQALAELKENARHEIMQVAPLFIGNYAVNRSLQEALKRGVRMRIIVRKATLGNKKSIQMCQRAGAQVRKLDAPDLLSMAIRDSEDMLLGAQDYYNSEERLTIYTRNKALIAALKKNFEQAWRKAKPIKA